MKPVFSLLISFLQKEKEQPSTNTFFLLETPCCIRQHILYLSSKGDVEKVSQHLKELLCFFSYFQLQTASAKAGQSTFLRNWSRQSFTDESQQPNIRTEQRNCCPIRAQSKNSCFHKSFFYLILILTESSGDGRTSFIPALKPKDLKSRFVADICYRKVHSKWNCLQITKNLSKVSKKLVSRTWRNYRFLPIQ